MEAKCPGHEGKCKFCKSEKGSPQSVGGMPIVDRLTGEPKIDPCCKSCASNLKSEKKQFERTSLS